MTAAEMLLYFRERYNLSSNVNWGKQDDELYLYLNAAVSKFINNRVSGNNILNSAVGFNMKSIDEIRTLITTSNIIAPSGSATEISNSIFYQLPSDYLYGLQVYILDSTSSTWRPCEFISYIESRKYINHSKNNPIIDIPKVIINDDVYIVVIHDSDDTITNGKITYIKKPAVIASGVDCDLPEQVHHEIVEIAVTLAIEGTESPRIQSQVMIEKTFQ